MGDATRPRTPGSSDAPGDCTPRCRRPPRPRRTARQQTTTEMSETSYGTAQAGAQTLNASGLRDFRVPFVTATKSGEHREYKQTWKAYDCFFGLPRGRTVHSSPNGLAVSVTQLGSPKGRPRLTQQRNAATSASVCGWLTSCSQSVGGAEGAKRKRPPTLCYLGNMDGPRCPISLSFMVP